MRQVLIVANRTLGGDQLAAAVRERLAQGQCEFFLVVPATPPPRDVGANFGSSFVAGGMLGPPTYETGRKDAERRLLTGLTWLATLGASTDGEVGPENPQQAVAEVMGARPVDEIIVSTLPHGVSRWLHQDLPHRLVRRYKIPVTTVTARARVSP